MPLYDAYKLEQMIIEDLEPYSYVPSDKFEGRTECYKLNSQQIADLSEIIESFKYGSSRSLFYIISFSALAYFKTWPAASKSVNEPISSKAIPVKTC